MALLLKFVEKLKAAMLVELSAKTGWGRNEISAALQRAIDKALAEVVQ